MAKKNCKHSIFDSKCESCNQLKNKWYAKLGDFNGPESGDIEKDEDHLKIWSADKFRFRHAGIQGGGWQAKFEYYQMAERFLNEYKFKESIQEIVWEYHVKGLSEVDIADTFRKLSKRHKYANKNKVAWIIKSHKAKMFDMYLLPKKEYYE